MSGTAQGQPVWREAAEVAVLGAMLLDTAAITTARTLVSADDFYRPAHRHLFAAIVAVQEAGEVPDSLTVTARLEVDGTLAAVGGHDGLAALWQAVFDVPTAASVAHHAGLVARASAQRRLATTLRDLLALAEAPGADPATTAAAGVRELLPTAASTRSKGFVPVGHLLWDAMERVEARARGETADLVSLGLPELDGEAVGGAEAGDLVTLLLVSGHGKTALQLAMARYAAQAGTTVGFVSAEMAGRQLVYRMLSGMAGVPYGRLRRGALNDDEWPRFARAGGLLSTLPLHIDDTALPSLSDIGVRVRALRATHPGLQLVFVDYAQLLSAEGETRARQIEAIANGLKGLAKECGIVVVQSAQPDGQLIDRRADGDKMPQLADIAWGQAIRNASDLVVCGYRPGKYDPMTDDDTIRLRVRKSRASGEEDFWLRWHGPTMLAWSPTMPAPFLALNQGDTQRAA